MTDMRSPKLTDGGCGFENLNEIAITLLKTSCLICEQFRHASAWVTDARGWPLLFAGTERGDFAGLCGKPCAGAVACDRCPARRRVQRRADRNIWRGDRPPFGRDRAGCARRVVAAAGAFGQCAAESGQDAGLR